MTHHKAILWLFTHIVAVPFVRIGRYGAGRLFPALSFDVLKMYIRNKFVAVLFGK